MKKEVVPNSEKVTRPDNSVMEPIMYEVDRRAIFYGYDWAGTVKIGDLVGWYRSNQSNRPHEEKWKKYLADHSKVPEAGELAPVFFANPEAQEPGDLLGYWDGSSFYFTPYVGEETYGLYKTGVLEGTHKAYAAVWYNRFVKIDKSCPSFEQLVESYPELYAKKAAVKKPATTQPSPFTTFTAPTTSTENFLEALGKSDLKTVPVPNWEKSEPTVQELKKIKGEDKVVVKAEQWDHYEHSSNELKITLSGAPTSERVMGDIYIIKGPDGKDRQFCKVMVANDITGEDELWILERGKEHTIHGMKVVVEK